MTSNGNDFLVLAPVDGWQVLGDSAGGFWIRDIDLGERVGLARPRDVRQTIKKAIQENVLKDWRAHGRANPTAEKLDVSGKPSQISEDYWRPHGGANPTAYFREVFEQTRSGKGRTEMMRAFYLDQNATVIILNRLRTKLAATLIAALTIGAVRAFDTYANAQIPASKLTPSAQFVTTDQFDQRVDYRVDTRLKTHGLLPASVPQLPRAPEERCAVDDWLVNLVKWDRAGHFDKLRGLLLVLYAGCHDATCSHATCEWLHFHESGIEILTRLVERRKEYDKRTVRQHFEDFARYNVIRLLSDTSDIVFKLQPDPKQWRPEERWGCSPNRIDEELKWLKKACEVVFRDIGIPAKITHFLDNFHGDQRIWYPCADSLTPASVVQSVPEIQPAPLAPLAPAPVVIPKLQRFVVAPPEIPPPTDKNEALYEMLADMGYPHLRVRRAIKELGQEYIEMFSVDDLTQEAINILARRTK